MGSEADPGPSLLLDWHAAMEPPRWIRAGVASLAAHAVLIAFALMLFNLDTSPVRTTEIVSDFRQVTPLYLPLELTQKAPNRGKVAKEVNAEDLLPRPASQARLPPAPAVRSFRPPIPRNPVLPQPSTPNVTEPPKLDAALNPPALPAPAGTPKAPPPPQIQPVEKPKLAFETPGQNGPAPDTSAGHARLTPPKATVDEAVRSLTHSGGAEIEQPPNLAPSPQLPPAPGQLGSPLELLSDPQGADFKPYLARILALVRQNWLAIIPQSARMGARGTVVLEFAIDRNGQVLKVVIATTSGSQVLDKAAVAAISASVPFPPLPPDYRGLSARLQFAFKYNFR